MKRIAVILLVAASCKKEPVAAPGPVAQPAAPAPAAEEGGFTLTPQMLDAYLEYQRLASAVGAGDGGAAYDRASRDDAALKAAGLTDAQLAHIDEIVSAVIARRMVTQLAANPEFVPDMAAMQAALNEEQKKHMAEAMAAFKQQQAEAKELTDERKRFGTKNIDVVLAREAEVTKAWSEMMGLAQPAGH